MNEANNSNSKIERGNLLSIFKSCLKDLLDSCLPHHSCLNDEHPRLRHLLIILQHVLCHLPHERSSFSFESRSVWSLIERVASKHDDMHECVLSIKEMNNVRTALGRLRVWMHLSLMQKKLSDHFNHILSHHTLLTEYYQASSIMLTDDVAIISGLLSSLNFLDYVFINKDDDFDRPLQSINFSSFIQSNMTTNEKAPSVNGSEGCQETKDWTELVSQKRYLEEVNQSLSTRLTNIDKNSTDLTSSNSLLKEELFESRRNMVVLQREVGGMEGAVDDAKKNHASQIEEKDCQLTSLRKQLEEVKAFNLSEISRNSELEESLQHKEAVLLRVEEKCQQLAVSLEALEALNTQLQRDNTCLVGEVERIRQEVIAKETHNYKLTKEAEIEKGRRGVLEGLVDEGRIKMVQMEAQFKVTSQIKKDNENLQKQLKEFNRIKLDQELALEEIGTVLSQSKLQVDTLEESGCDGVTWVDDGSVTQCYACLKSFSVSRRKHHCRRCGHIFCGDCSNHKATLPNHFKAARVCLTCHTVLQATSTQ